jgi:GNAT superfamily N-acetyltransferase
MKIVEYDDVDPYGVLNLNLMGLGYALTPERVALIRQLDARPFPCFAVYAIEDGIVAGQVGVFRLPTVTTEGLEEVGGVWAVCTHPALSRRGIATRLLDEAHARMRSAGLRFSTLGTSRYRAAHKLYQRHGYEDVFSSVAAFTRWERVSHDSRMRAERAAGEGLELADKHFQRVAAGHLGFARRQSSFIPMLVATGDVGAGEVWLLWKEDELVGYALATVSESILTVKNLLLVDGVDAADAVLALGQALSITYLRVRMDHPSVAASLHRAGYPPALPDWDTFMIKPLIPAVTTADARRLLGIGTQRFLISSIDLT